MFVRRAVFAIVVVALVAGCAGAIPTSSVSSPPGLSSAPPAGSTAAVSVAADAVSEERSDEAIALGQRVETAMTGVRSVSGTIAVTAGPLRYDGPFSATVDGGEPTAMQASFEVRQYGKDHGPMLMRWVEDRLYVGGPSVLQQAEVSDPAVEWVDMTNESTFERSVEVTAAVRARLMAAAALDVSDAGAEKVRTAAARRYELRALPELLGEHVSGDLRRWIDRDVLIRESVDGTVLVQLWLDAQDRPVRMSEEYDTGYYSVQIVTEIDQFDPVVEIAAPDPATVD